jgi:two-component sensor histidine kinase
MNTWEPCVVEVWGKPAVVIEDGGLKTECNGHRAAVFLARTDTEFAEVRTAHGSPSDAHRTMEARLRSALARAKSLIHEKDAVIRNLRVARQECDHRLLNNLQMVVSLLGSQSRMARNPEVASQLSIAANRVGAIARIHRHLHSMDGRHSIDFKPYLRDLCREYSAILGSHEPPDRAIVVEGVEIDLRTAVAIPLGLIVNELLTNAIKHGKGRIAVRLMAGPHGHAISVSNDGANSAKGVDPAAGTGMGMKLISSLVDQIGGELRIDRGEHDEGTTCLVSFN